MTPKCDDDEQPTTSISSTSPSSFMDDSQVDGPPETGYLATVTSPCGTADGFLDRLRIARPLYVLQLAPTRIAGPTLLAISGNALQRFAKPSARGKSTFWSLTCIDSHVIDRHGGKASNERKKILP